MGWGGGIWEEGGQLEKWVQLLWEKVDDPGSWTTLEHIASLATAQRKQGKQGIWFLLFPDRENTGNLVLTQGKIC